VNGTASSRAGRWSGLVDAARGALGRHGRALVPIGREAEPQSQFVGLQERTMGEAPKVSLAAQMSVYLADPMARSAVDFLAEQVAGPGFHTTAGDGGAKGAIDDFCARVNLDEMLLSAAREVVGFGNCFWERTADGPVAIPILSVEAVMRTPRGAVQGYRQARAYGGGVLRPDGVVHFRWNAVNGEAFGSGLLRTLLEGMRLSDGETRPCFAEMKARMQRAMIEQFEKFSAPNELWIFRNLGQDELQAYANLLRRIPRRGARFAYNDEADVKQATQPLGRGWEAYVDSIVNDFLLGLQTPIPRLFTTPGFTEASARAALEAAERKVMSIQRFLKRVVEREVFEPVLRGAGYDPAEARVRLDWGQPQVPDLAFSDLLAAFDKGAIGREELRGMLAKAGWELTNSEPDPRVRK